MATHTKPRRLTSRKQITALLEGALDRSPADETELVWIEARQARALLAGRRPEIEERREQTVLIRVIDRGRIGSHRTGSVSASELDGAVRAAVAQSRAREPVPGLPHLPTDDGTPTRLPPLRDAAVSNLDGGAVESLVESSRRGSDRIRLRWADARVAVFSSRGIRRGVSVTAVQLEVQCGRGPGRGVAVDASRQLQDLRVEATFERAREARASEDLGAPPAEPVGAVLSPEAAAGLVDLLNREAFTAVAYHEGGSLLRQHLGIQVFDRALTLRDDATDPAGLPFPFDLEGTHKRPVELIERGIPRTPALDQRQAAILGLQPTGHAVGASDARAENLFLMPGELDLEALLGLADGGLWVGRLGALECFEPSRLQIRAVLQGVRRIRDGRLAEALPDLRWQTSLLRSFASIDGLGAAACRTLGASGFMGGISAPALVIKVPELGRPAEALPR